MYRLWFCILFFLFLTLFFRGAKLNLGVWAPPQKKKKKEAKIAPAWKQLPMATQQKKK